MAKKHPSKDIKYSEAERKGETHMQIFARLAAVKNMHNHPGPRKPKKG